MNIEPTNTSSNNSQVSHSQASQINQKSSRLKFKRKSSKGIKGKLKFVLTGGLMLLLVAGAGAGFYLSQQDQDIRHQASGSNWQNYCGDPCSSDGDCPAGFKCVAILNVRPSVPTCFLPGTLIHLSDGSTKKIEQIQVGDKVMSFDLEQQTRRHSTVKQVEKKEHQGYYVINDQLRLTANHPLYLRKNSGQVGWGAINPTAAQKHHLPKFDVKQIEVGDWLRTIKGWQKISDIEFVQAEVKTYNLIGLDPVNNYFADGYLAHNKKPIIHEPPPHEVMKQQGPDQATIASGYSSLTQQMSSLWQNQVYAQANSSNLLSRADNHIRPPSVVTAVPNSPAPVHTTPSPTAVPNSPAPPTESTPTPYQPYDGSSACGISSGDQCNSSVPCCPGLGLACVEEDGHEVCRSDDSLEHCSNGVDDDGDGDADCDDYKCQLLDVCDNPDPTTEPTLPAVTDAPRLECRPLSYVPQNTSQRYLISQSCIQNCVDCSYEPCNQECGPGRACLDGLRCVDGRCRNKDCPDSHSCECVEPTGEPGPAQYTYTSVGATNNPLNWQACPCDTGPDQQCEDTWTTDTDYGEYCHDNLGAPPWLMYERSTTEPDEPTPAECAGGCNDGNPCTIDMCDAGSCVHNNKADGITCGPDGEVCAEGTCVEPTINPTDIPQTGIRFKINLTGIPHVERANGEIINVFLPNEPGKEVQVKITLEDSQGRKTQPILRKFVYIDEDENGYYQMAEPFEFEDLSAGEYQILLKGPMHRQMKFCKNNQEKGKVCATAERIQINPGDDVEFDFRGDPLQAGDLPISGDDRDLQDGIVNTKDYGFMVGCFSNMRDEACVARADLNFDGVVNNLDRTLLITTLETMPDQL